MISLDSCLKSVVLYRWGWRWVLLWWCFCCQDMGCGKLHYPENSGRKKQPAFMIYFWSSEQYWFVVSNIFYSHPYLWKMNPFWRLHIFQKGWFNHQLEYPSPFFARNLMADLRVKGVKGSCATWLFWSGPKVRWRAEGDGFAMAKTSGKLTWHLCFKGIISKGSLMVFQSHDFWGSYVKLRGVIVCLFLRGTLKKIGTEFCYPKELGEFAKRKFGGGLQPVSHTFWMNLFVSCFLLETGWKKPLS